MANSNTTDNVIKSILAARSKESVMDSIERATQGKALPEKTLTAIHDGLMKNIKSDKAEIVVGQIMSILKASAALPDLRVKADNLFETTRKGTKYTAIRAGIAAYNQGLGDNEITEAMAEKCPEIDDAEKAKAQLLSLLNQAKNKCPDADATQFIKALDKIINKLA